MGEMSELLFLGEDVVTNLALKSSFNRLAHVISIFFCCHFRYAPSQILRKVETDELFDFFGVNFLLFKIEKRVHFYQLDVTKKVQKIKDLIKMNKRNREKKKKKKKKKKKS